MQLVLAIGFVKLLRDILPAGDSTPISVVAAAKNEAKNIEGLFNCIKNIKYADETFEVIIVDDNSVDGTYEKAGKASESNSNFRIFKAGEKSLPAKRGALLTGIKEAKYPYIMITDADCLPSSGWLSTASALFEQGYDFVFGPAPLLRRKNNFISNLSCMENLKSHFLSFSLASLGLPYTAAARNMGFSKEAFFKIGGYKKTLDTVSGDDDLLLREAAENKLKIKAFFDERAMVYSYAKDNLHDYLNQKTRHTQTSLYYRLKVKLILAGWHLFNLFMLFSPILMFINLNFVWLVVVKLSTDILILSSVQKKLNYRFNFIRLLYLDIAYEIFLVINFINSIFRKVEWKKD